MRRLPDPLRGLLALLLAFLVGWGGLAWYGAHQRAIGAERAAARARAVQDSIALAAARDSLQASRRALADAGAAAARAHVSYRTIRDTVYVPADVPDDAPVTVPAGLVRTCDLVDATCATQRAALAADTLRANDLIRRQQGRIADLERDLADARRPRVGSALRGAVAGGLIGFGVCSVRAAR